MIMASFLAVHRHSVLMLFAVVALTLFACSSDSNEDSGTATSSSSNIENSSSSELNSSSSVQSSDDSSSSSENSNSSSSLGEQTYTVTYNANSGTDEVIVPTAQTKTHGVDLILSNDVPTRTGYTFYIWNAEKDGSGVNYADGENYLDNADLTLYAQWRIITYSITYNANGGSGTPNTQTKNYGEDIELRISTVPTRINYTFLGWNTMQNGNGITYEDGQIYKDNAPLALYAIWKVNTHTLIVTASEGGTVSPYGTTTHNATTTVTVTATADEGYEFHEWTDENGKLVSGLATISVPMNKDTTLKAIFIETTGTDSENSGTFDYKNQTYKWVKIFDQIWMAENLNYDVEGSMCYNKNEDNCTKYGRLYDWTTAMELPECDVDCEVGDNHQGICPDGWHIPSQAEWSTLTGLLGGGDEASRYLKAETGWSNCTTCEDTYGFAALPGGSYSSPTANPTGEGTTGQWWFADQMTGIGIGVAYYTRMQSSNTQANIHNINKTYFFSIRCLKN